MQADGADWDELAAICRSFELISPTSEPCAEPVANFEMDEPFELRFNCPATWNVDRSEVAHTSAKLYLDARDEQGMIGRIWLRSILGDKGMRVANIFELAAEDLREMGGDLSNALVTEGQPSPQFGKAVVATSHVEGRSDLVATSLVQRSHDYGAALTLLCPTWESSCECWGRSKRAMEIVRDSLAIGAPAT
jgi:hypothetical protein